jgi:hypothetical protein
MRFSPVRRVVVVGAVIAAFAVAGSAALAAIPSSSGTVYSCVNKTTGVMRAINYPGTHCTSKERMVTLASATVMPKHVAGTFIASNVADSSLTAIVRIQVDATATGALRDGYIEGSWLTGPADLVGIETRATVDTVRFFTATSGAHAGEITGWNCIVAAGPASVEPVGTCTHYRQIVTDGASKGLADTTCRGNADVTVVTDPMYCPYIWNVDKGNIRIWSGY